MRPRLHTDKAIDEELIEQFIEQRLLKHIQFGDEETNHVGSGCHSPPFGRAGPKVTYSDMSRQSSVVVASYLFGRFFLRPAKRRRPVLPALYRSLSAGSPRLLAFSKINLPIFPHNTDIMESIAERQRRRAALVAGLSVPK